MRLLKLTVLITYAVSLQSRSTAQETTLATQAVWQPAFDIVSISSNETR